MNMNSRIQHIEKLQAAPRRLLVGIAIMVFSSLIGSVVMQRDHNVIEVLQATRAVAAADMLTLADTRIVRVPSSLESGQWASASDLAMPQRLTRSVRPGQLLYQSDLGASESGESVFAAALDPQTIPIGLVAGSQVQLWSVGDGDALEARLITSNATVVGLEMGDRREPAWASIRLPPQFLADAIQVSADERLRLVTVD